MCLKTVTWSTDNPKEYKNKRKWTKGYKVFHKGYPDDTKFTFLHFTTPFVLNKILKANSSRTCSSKGVEAMNKTYYQAGFHIFTVQMAAKLFINDNNHNYGLFEVEYRKINAEGTHNVYTQYQVDCIIAQEMRILRRMEFPTEPTQKKLRVWRNGIGKMRKEDKQ